MRFWLRELAGWALLLLGLYLFYVCVAMLLNHYLLEASPVALIGVIVFRGGLHLLKVAVAARVCLYAQREVRGQEAGGRTPGAGARLPQRSTRPG